MSDLIKRLRDGVKWEDGDYSIWSTNDVMHIAADRIEHLEQLKSSVENFLKVKGRYHTEQAYRQLEEAFKKVL